MLDSPLGLSRMQIVQRSEGTYRTVRVTWCGWRDLNPRHSVPKTDALSAELQPH